MAIQCDDAQARMMDLLYGELAGDDRTAVEAHVGACARCQAELAGFQRTRATLRGALEQPPPARAREVILRAATIQAAALAGSRPVAEKPPRRPVPQPGTSIGDWLRRRWALPTLATVGAVAVFLLASKMFLKPDKMMQTAPQDDSVIGELAEKEGPSEAPAPPPAPARAPVADSPKSIASAKPSPAGGSRGGAKQADGARFARLAKKAEVARVAEEGGNTPRASGAGVSEKSEPVARFAAPPPPRAPTAGAIANLVPPQAAANQAAPRKAKVAADEGAETGAAPAAAPPRREVAAAAPAQASSAAPLSESYGDSTGKHSASRRAAKASSDDEAESAVQRADRLFAKARWVEAAAAYRRLLQREPASPDAPRWRQRLAAAEKNARDNAGLEPTP